MIRNVLTALTAIPFVLFVVDGPRPATAEMASPAESLAQKVLGREDAPVTMYAFESMTCPHCAAFHRETLGKLKEEYIDTGKLKLVYVEFPLDARAMAASMLARCTAKNRFFGMVEILFHNQRKWATAQDFHAAMLQMSKVGGLTDSEFESCMKNEALYNSIRQNQAEAQKEHDVHSTPTFVINGTKVVGAQPFEEFDKIIKPLVN